MKKLPARTAIAAAILLLLVLSAASPNLCTAQSEIDQVHITPLLPHSVVSPDAALNTHTNPIKVDVSLVLVPVTITDARERLIVGLKPKDFEVFDGKSRQEIRHFSSEDGPISLGVILDLSGSMNSKIERAREAVLAFLKSANPQDEFFLITFADRPQLLTDFTNSVEDVQAQLLYTIPKGRTALLDAIYMGVTKMRQAKYSKRALLIISDGGDNHSRYTERDIRSLVKEADVMLYGVGIYDRTFATVWTTLVVGYHRNNRWTNLYYRQSQLLARSRQTCWRSIAESVRNRVSPGKRAARRQVAQDQDQITSSQGSSSAARRGENGILCTASIGRCHDYSRGLPSSFLSSCHSPMTRSFNSAVTSS